MVWDAPWYWGYWPYYNPYFVDVIVVDGAVIDYSRPIVLAAPMPGPSGAAAVVDPTLAESQSLQFLDASRDAFRRGDYAAALSLIHQAIAWKPNDPMLHQFRGLILFATGQYRPAAAATYAVLSVGPGWDWPTLLGFYRSADVYAAQLRALEQYQSANPALPEIRFLLAYHYLSCGQNEAAVMELREAVRLNPKDPLSAQLLAGLTANQLEAPPAAGQPPVRRPPVDAASLLGVWEATRGDGASFTFTLSADAAYSWQHVQQGRSRQFTGTYLLADNLLILKRNGEPTMIGQVTTLADGQFNFKLVGSNPSDPGITFRRK